MNVTYVLVDLQSVSGRPGSARQLKPQIGHPFGDLAKSGFRYARSFLQVCLILDLRVDRVTTVRSDRADHRLVRLREFNGHEPYPSTGRSEVPELDQVGKAV